MSAADPLAASYNLHRSEAADAWPATPYRRGIGVPSVVLPGEADATPADAFYRVSGVSCSGVEGP